MKGYISFKYIRLFWFSN